MAMRHEGKSDFNFSLVLAACIVAAGLIVGAVIIRDRPSSPPSSIAPRPQAVPTLSETSVRQQFISQLQAQLAGRIVKVMGEKQPFQSVEVDKVEFATKGDEIAIEYAVHWQKATTVTGCTLTKVDFGHFTNGSDATTLGDGSSAFHPNLDIQ